MNKLITINDKEINFEIIESNEVNEEIKIFVPANLGIIDFQKQIKLLYNTIDIELQNRNKQVINN